VPQESLTSIDTLAGTVAGSQDGISVSQTSAPTVPAEASAPVEENVTFEELGLSPLVLKAIADSGYTKPTPIQAKGIPQILRGRDIIGIAQTGTGKTASFTLPMIEILSRGRAKARMPRTLILEPTRELAAQVAESFERYGKYHKLSMALLIGGVSFDEQDRKLDRGVDVLIATPGRLLDHVGRGKLMMTGVQILVIDEADRMLDMGFIPDVEKIAKMIPFTRQTLFFSATMPPEIQRLTDQFLQGAVRIEASRPATAASTITQVLVDVPGGEWSKRESLRRLIRENTIKNAIVFCNRKRDVDVVAKSLTKHGFSAAPLHGDLEQSLRTKTLEAFKAGEIQLLVASDVAARGLDIPDVGHVFNFDVPFHADDYVHRIGRTGRAGRSGAAFTLVGGADQKNVAAIERLIGQTIIRRTMEGLPEEQERPRGERERDKNRNRRGGKDRDKDRNRPRKEHGQVASMDPVAPSQTYEPTPQAAQPVQAPVQSAPQASPAPQRNQQPRQEQPRQEKRRDAPKQNNAESNLNELPAFLLRPVVLPPPTPKRTRSTNQS